MKTAPAPLLLLGVCVLLLSALTVSAVSLSVSPNLQQFFRGSSVVTVSCTDGQTVDGWTLRRSRGGLTEDCGAAASQFGRVYGSSCVLDFTTNFTAVYWCETRSGQQSDEVSISVSEQGLILEIPALPVRTGSDVTLRCKRVNGDTVKAFFFINGSSVGPKSEHVITNVQQSDEGFYSCSTDKFGSSPQSSLRVRGPPTVCPPPSPPVSSSVTSTLSIRPPAACPPPPPPPPPPPSCLVPVAASLVSMVLLVLVGVLLLWRKLKGGGGADSVSVGLGGGDGCEEPAEKRVRWSVCLCFSGLFLLTAAGVCVLLLSALTVPADPPPPPPCVSVIRLFCHLVVFCPYCISTGLLLSICCSRKPAISMEMTQQGQGLGEEYDDITADVTTEHAF